MQEMSRRFNDDKVVENLYTFFGDTKRDYLPHGVTENEFPKIAGYKINLPFVAGTQHVRLTVLIRCSIMKLQVKNIRKKKKDSPSLTPKRRKME